MEFSELVKETKKRLEITREEFCILLSINQSTLYRWENNTLTPTPIYQTIIVYLWRNYKSIKNEIEKDRYQILRKEFNQRDKDRFFERQMSNLNGFGIPVLDLIKMS